MLSRILIAALASALAVTAAACGGDNTPGAGATTLSETDLRQAVQDTRDAVQNTIQDLRNSTSKDDAASALQTGADELSSAADRLGQAQAPQGSESAKSDLERAARDLADQMRQAADGIQSGSLAQIASSIRGLDALGALNRALDDLRANGVDVPNVETTG